MFECYRSLFLYAVTPVHMGAGTGLGLIDSPIQREKHTEFPMIAGSGLKGAVRHALSFDDDKKGDLVSRYFGPDAGSSDLGAGAVSFTDAQIVLYPVQNPKGAFSYVTSPLALFRMERLLNVAGVGMPAISLSSLEAGKALVPDESLLFNKKELVLESLNFVGEVNETVKKVANWLSENALPADDTHNYFRGKIKESLVVLSDTDFSYLVRTTTLVEPHVRIDPETGTASDGGLFYVENLPPESLLISLVMASRERPVKKTPDGGLHPADKVIEWVTSALSERLLQVGGDATTGRGQILCHFANSKENA